MQKRSRGRMFGRLIAAALWAVAGMLFCGALSSAAAEPQRCRDGICFPQNIAVGSQRLPLRGMALLEYLIFDVYTAAFYAESGVDTVEEALGRRPKAIVVQYHRGLSREDFIESTEKLLRANPAVDVEALRAKLSQLYAMYTGVAAGDRYLAVFEPSAGTTLSLNGVAQGTISGEAFQQAYFGIWLSRHSVGGKFTAELLGKGD